MLYKGVMWMWTSLGNCLRCSRFPHGATVFLSLLFNNIFYWSRNSAFCRSSKAALPFPHLISVCTVQFHNAPEAAGWTAIPRMGLVRAACLKVGFLRPLPPLPLLPAGVGRLFSGAAQQSPILWTQVRTLVELSHNWRQLKLKVHFFLPRAVFTVVLR